MSLLFCRIWLDLQGSSNDIHTYAAHDSTFAHDGFVTVRSGVGVKKQWKSYDEGRQLAGFVCYTLGASGFGVTH